MEIHANPSGAPIAGGATTPGSRFGGSSPKAQVLKLIARVGRRMSAFAYRRLRDLELEREHDPSFHDRRAGSAGSPARAAGGPPPHEHD
jgi:hypothetical protein